MPTLMGVPLGWPLLVLGVPVLLRPQAATLAAARMVTAAVRAVLALGRLIVIPPLRAGLVHGARARAPRAPVNQPLPQAGLGLTIATEPVALVGSTWTNFAPACHWKMKCAATTFSPMALNFAGPCTVCTVTPLCR